MRGANAVYAAVFVVLVGALVLTAVSGAVATRGTTGVPQNAATSTPGSLPNACVSAFPSASTTTNKHQTEFYNRQASVQMVVCYGFGFDSSNVPFSLTPELVCGVLTGAIGAIGGTQYDELALYVDGACSGAVLALDPGIETFVGAACGWAADLLGVAVGDPNLGTVTNGLCIAAGITGHHLGSWAESRHEREVAQDIMQRGECLKYSPSHFGSPWLAVACDPSDPGFSNLPVASSGGGGGGTGVDCTAPPLLSDFHAHFEPAANFNDNAEWEIVFSITLQPFGGSVVTDITIPDYSTAIGYPVDFIVPLVSAGITTPTTFDGFEILDAGNLLALGSTHLANITVTTSCGSAQRTTSFTIPAEPPPTPSVTNK